MAQTYEELKKLENREEIFQQIKSDGYKLLQQGEIDAPTYYAKTREAGIELGLIDERDYPGRLPGFAEPFLEILGGTAGAIGGFVVGGPVGAAAGAGLGSGSGSLAADFLGDLLAPDMPAPTTQQRLQDAATVAAVDTALTATVPIAGKALSSQVKNIIESSKDQAKKIADKLPSGEKRLGMVERTLGLTDDASKKAEELSKEGIPLSFGQASDSPFVRGVFNLTSRMPLAGAPGQKELLKTFKAVDVALDKRIAPTAKLKPLTETERSKLIQEFGMESFDNWRRNYKSLYRRAEKLNKRKGDYFSLSNLALVAQRAYPKSEFAKVPPDVTELVVKLRNDANKKISFDDVNSLSNRVSDLSKKYDPATGAEKNQQAYTVVTAIQNQLKNQIRNPNDEAGRLIAAGDRLFKEYMAVVEGPTGKQFQKALSRGALRPGVGRPPISRVEDLYKNTFGDAKSPQAVRELKELIGVERVNTLAANYLDDVLTKYIKSDKRNFEKLYNELGFDNLKGKKFEATKELLKDYKFTNADDLYKFMNVLKDFPEAIPDVNTFVQRSGILRAAQGVGPSAVIGTMGIQAGAGVAEGVAGVGFLRLLNSFLSKPFNKNALKNFEKSSEEQKKNFIRKFLDSIPQLPDVPASAIAVQPAVPFVSEEIQK